LLLLFNSILDGLNFIVWVNINGKCFCAKFNVDGDTVKVSNDGSSSLNTRVSNSLSVIESNATFDKLIASVNSLLLLDFVLDSLNGVVRVNRDIDLFAININMNSNGIVVGSDDCAFGNTGVEDGLSIVKNYGSLLQGIDCSFNSFLGLDGIFDCLNLVVGINLDVKGLGTKLNLDANRLEVCSDGLTRLNAGVSNCFGVFEDFTSLYELVTTFKAFLLLDLVFDGLNSVIGINGNLYNLVIDVYLNSDNVVVSSNDSACFDAGIED
jgi:hypothetical protein